MKKITPDLIPPDARAWFGNQMQGLAIRHDLAGPDISRLTVEKYKRQLIVELKSRARAAVEAGELAIDADDLDIYCGIAAEELARMRQIKAAHKAGKLPIEVLRQLPAYGAFQDYFIGTPSLIYREAIAVARHLFKSDKRDADSKPLSQPGHPRHPVSRHTRAWMELQALGLACADDAWGAPFGAVPRDEYVTDSALRIREHARQAIRAGDLRVHPEDVDKICWVVGCEAYLLRSLKAGKESGELSDLEIKQMPIYGPYRAYFEMGSEFIATAKTLAAGAGLPTPPDTSN